MGHLFLIITNKNYTIVLLDVENIDGRTDESIYNRTNASGKEDEVGEETSQKHVFEYYGDDYELSEVQPTKTIPIPKRIMVKCVARESKKKKSVHVDGSEQKEKSSIEMMENEYSEKFTTADDNETMEMNDKDNNNLQGCVKRNTVLTDSSVSGEESIANSSISLQNNHLKRTAIDENDYSSNDGIISRAIEEQVRNVVEHSCSPIAGKTDSSITIETRNRSASPLPSPLNTDNSIKASSPKQQQVISSQSKQRFTPSQRKQKVARMKKIITENIKSKE
ncbi:unnamed protein product [Rotaria sp. Silwood2]|nr:unnamed protein product [Rotaria sp. Silwood2]